MTLTAVQQLALKAAIRRHGWVVLTKVHPLGLVPPYVYSCGFTDAGLPELVMYDLRHPAGAQVGRDVITHLARRHLAEDLQPGRAYPTRVPGADITVEPAVDDPQLPVHAALALYGDRLRLLRIEPVLDGF